MIVPPDDHRSPTETAYLLRDPENAHRLEAAIKRLESGAGTQHDLVE